MSSKKYVSVAAVSPLCLLYIFRVGNYALFITKCLDCQKINSNPRVLGVSISIFSEYKFENQQTSVLGYVR